jgi:hypothetical protein
MDGIAAKAEVIGSDAPIEETCVGECCTVFDASGLLNGSIKELENSETEIAEPYHLRASHPPRLTLYYRIVQAGNPTTNRDSISSFTIALEGTNIVDEICSHTQ